MRMEMNLSSMKMAHIVTSKHLLEFHKIKKLIILFPSNKDAETGKTSSNFYNDGRGNAHYRKSEPDSYSYHENTFDGSRNYRGGNSSRHH